MTARILLILSLMLGAIPAPSAQADEPRASPGGALEEMRAAATEAAEVDPERVPSPRLALQAVRAVVEPLRREIVREIVREAVRAEVERERVERSQGRGPPVLPPGLGGAPRGQSAAAHARGAAAHAQDAIRNKDIAKERGKDKMDDKPGKGVGLGK